MTFIKLVPLVIEEMFSRKKQERGFALLFFKHAKACFYIYSRS